MQGRAYYTVRINSARSTVATGDTQTQWWWVAVTRIIYTTNMIQYTVHSSSTILYLAFILVVIDSMTSEGMHSIVIGGEEGSYNKVFSTATVDG